MDSNISEIMGKIANEAYVNYHKNDLIQSLPQYEVKATQDDLIGSLFPHTFGFQAMLLQETQSGEYVIAFRGTEGKVWPWNAITDLATDASMAVGNFTTQMQMSLAFVDAALDHYASQGLTRANLSFTGHSLGGSLAEVAGYTFGCDTYAYNPFGVKWSLETSPATYIATLLVLEITSEYSTEKITNIVNVGGNFSDPITGVGSHLLDSYIGDIQYVKNSEGGTLAPHGIDALKEEGT